MSRPLKRVIQLLLQPVLQRHQTVTITEHVPLKTTIVTFNKQMRHMPQACALVTDEGRQTKGKEEEKCDVEHNKTKDYEKEGGVLFPTTYVRGGWKDRLVGERIRWGNVIQNV
jgi:hypothetical protein